MSSVSELIQLALGEASALFMKQGDTPAGQIVMPSEELITIGERLETALYQELQRREHEKGGVRTEFGTPLRK